jgi:hypothetical protein
MMRGLTNRRGALLLFLATTFAIVVVARAPGASTPLPAGHYAGPATATWSVTSSPGWLGGLALKVIEVREGVDDIPASGSCTGVVGLNVPGGGAAFTGAARCEFAGGLAKYNNRVASLAGQEFAAGVRGTATCCGTGEEVKWSARRDAANVLTGEAAGSSAATAVSVETWLGDVEVSLRVDWTVAFVAARVD